MPEQKRNCCYECHHYLRYKNKKQFPHPQHIYDQTMSSECDHQPISLPANLPLQRRA